MEAVLLDTDILSEILKRKNQAVLRTADNYLEEHGRFSFSAITAYEILRGMKAAKATRQLRTFTHLIGTSDVLTVSFPVLTRAADLWAQGHRGGHPHNDADLMIAATAIHHDRVLVTGNTSHYNWIPNLRLSDWKSEA